MLPEGHRAICLAAGEDTPIGVRVAVILADRDEGVPSFSVLREGIDCRVLLGCLLDGVGGVLDWCEVWVQALPPATPEGLPALLMNCAADASWRRLRERLLADTMVHGWWEELSEPLVVDLLTDVARPTSVVLGCPCAVETDEARLADAGLPPYGTTLTRYLRVEEAPPVWIPLTEGAPTGAATTTLSDVLELPSPLLLNPAGGGVLVRRLESCDLRGYLQLLEGTSLSDAYGGERTTELGALPIAEEQWRRLALSDWHYLAGSRGAAGRAVETFHLKVRLLHGLADALRDTIEALRQPILNLSPDSFRVALPVSAEGGLPMLWNAGIRLVDRGVPVAVEGEDGTPFGFLRGANVDTAYSPAIATGRHAGRGRIRLHKAVAEAAGGVRVNGHLAIRELPVHADHALLRFRLEVEGVPLWFRATLDTATSVEGECPFTSFTCPAPATAIEALVAEKYLDFPDAHYEFVNVTDLGYDLISLGLLGTRVFLCGPEQSVRERAQDLRTFASSLEEGQLVPQIVAALRQDAAVASRFGPGCLAMAGDVSPEEVASVVPIDQWGQLLGVLIRLFGDRPESYHRPPRDGFSNGKAGMMLQRLLADLRALTLASRGLIVPDWEANAEIQSLLDDFASSGS